MIVFEIILPPSLTFRVISSEKLSSSRRSISLSSCNKSLRRIRSAMTAFDAFSFAIFCFVSAWILFRTSSRSAAHFSVCALHKRTLRLILYLSASFLCDIPPPRYSFLIAIQSIFLSIANHPLFVYKHSYVLKNLVPFCTNIIPRTDVETCLPILACTCVSYLRFMLFNVVQQACRFYHCKS